MERNLSCCGFQSTTILMNPSPSFTLLKVLSPLRTQNTESSDSNRRKEKPRDTETRKLPTSTRRRFFLPLSSSLLLLRLHDFVVAQRERAVLKACTLFITKHHSLSNSMLPCVVIKETDSFLHLHRYPWRSKRRMTWHQ